MVFVPFILIFTDWLFLSTFTWRWESNCFSFRQSTGHDLGFSRLTGFTFCFFQWFLTVRISLVVFFLPILTLGAIIGTLYGSLLVQYVGMDPIFVKKTF